MGKRGHTDEEILRVLREAEAGAHTSRALRKRLSGGRCAVHRVNNRVLDRM
jgi:hypothetical protein